MKLQTKAIKLCNCNATATLDTGGVGGALKDAGAARVHHALCRHEVGVLEAALAAGQEVLVGCTQEAALFESIASTQARALPVKFFNLREAGGWSAEAGAGAPKLAALIEAALLDAPEPVPAVSYRSEGSLLIAGPGREALRCANLLAGALDVAVLVTDRDAELPLERAWPVFSGELTAVAGYLGAFDVTWHQTNPIDLEACVRCGACIRACPESAIDFSYQVDLDKCRAHRACVAACGDIRAIDFQRAEATRTERFDLVLDLGAAPALAMPDPPQGYFAPGGDAEKLLKALVELPQLTGEFEKPKFFVYREKLCAHSRSEIEGCTRCIDVCSTRAISADGDHVKVEPHLCMGCGACASVCPSGAMTYAYPRMSDLGKRVKTLLSAYRSAGGRDALLLLHDADRGRELIARLARHGKGLPARAIPVEVHHFAAAGLDLLLSAIALGACQVVVLAAPSASADYLAATRANMALGDAILHGLGLIGEHFRLIVAGDFGALEDEIWSLAPAAEVPPASFAAGNDKRLTLEFAIEHLQRHAREYPREIPLPVGAPWGRVSVNKETCTLCMSCVGACPASALMDDPGYPRLRFVERNCLQCGLCEKTCPEQAITLTPRLLLTPEARQPQVLNEAEPFNCVRCGKPFGTRQMIDSMTAKLAGHSMFGGAALRRLQMCGDCRVIDMMQSPQNEATVFDYTR